MDEVCGLLLVDKPIGPSSQHTLTAIKKRLGIKKIGHAGTLDPLASGLLVCMVGKATKLSDKLLSADKVYSGLIRFGIATDTDDLEGEIIHQVDHLPNPELVYAAAREFVGTIEQTPPAYSAIKVNGRRSYALARKGLAPKLNSRTVTITEFSLSRQSDSDYQFRVACSKGTYIRALARDLGKALGSCACLAELRREVSSPFNVSQARAVNEISFDDIIPVDEVMKKCQG